MSSIALVAIQSVRFLQAFLRMDGSGVTQSQGSGSGTVNCQFYQGDGNPPPAPNVGVLEAFELIPILGWINCASKRKRYQETKFTQKT
jgi:hypothetical protein